MKAIDFGMFGWRHKMPDGAFQGYIYGCEENARKEVPAGAEVVLVDTRPTIGQVYKALRSEKRVWEEYFSMSTLSAVDGFGPDSKFPDGGRICVFVVIGGSEGMYLHVEIRFPATARNEMKVIILFLGKTLVHRKHTAKLWNSARRIAEALGA